VEDSAAIFTVTTVLKRDAFGCVEQGLHHGISAQGSPASRRRIDGCRWWLRPLARSLLRREAAALATLAAAGVPSVPRLLHSARDVLVRSWIEGRSMHAARPRTAAYFAQARRLLTALHRAGVTHNDSAKEQNWLVDVEGRPALVDFQLAHRTRRHGRWFRLLAREDLRHLLKHKRTCCPEALTTRERALLERPSTPSRLLRLLVKPVYNLTTRRLLHWQDQEGRG